MIKINLSLRKHAATSEQPKKGRASIRSLKIGLEDGKKFPIKKFAPPLIIVILVSMLIETEKEKKMAEATKLFNAVKKQNTQLMTELAKKKGYEEQKRRIDTDEFTMKSKIDIIEKLVSERGQSYTMLKTLSENIPENVWLTSFGRNGKSLFFVGRSLGFNPITDFMKKLDGDAYFKNLQLKKTEQIGGPGGQKISSFEIEAQGK